MKLVCTFLAAVLLVGCSQQPEVIADRTKYDAAVLAEVRKELASLRDDLSLPIYREAAMRAQRLEQFTKHLESITLNTPVIPAPGGDQAVLVRGLVTDVKEAGTAIVRCEDSSNDGVLLVNGVMTQRGMVGLRDAGHLQRGQAVSVWASQPLEIYFTNKLGEIRRGLDYLKHEPAD